MGKNSGIEWTDHTWNPWQGCHPVSRGCKNCYMYRDKKRFGQDPTTVVKSSDRTFNLPYRIKEPSKIFVCSWSDFFIEEADEWRDEAIAIMKDTPHLTYLVLTKRPYRMFEYFEGAFTPSNLWLGVTTEDQWTAEERVPWLLETSTNVRFVSVEPMLGKIDLTRLAVKESRTMAPPVSINALKGWMGGARRGERTPIDWVICGGETGDSAREMKKEWVIDLWQQCKKYNTPFFFKKVGDAWQSSPLEKRYQMREFPNLDERKSYETHIRI